MKTIRTDVLVIGTGIAGLSYALKATALGSVAIITKKRRVDSSTNRAQGGVAAVFAPGDSPELHARDTFMAGCGLCHTRAVLDLVREGPSRVRELQSWGVTFSQSDGDLDLGREGGHSRRRIVHAGDLTGREIERALLAALARESSAAIYEDHIALDLAVGDEAGTGRRRCAGVVALDHVHGERVAFEAGVVLLASGGFGQVYRHTTNPDIATGDGIAMAYRAGAAIANLEFVQFHPTALFPADEQAFLISEAVRGEGAVLRRADGSELMKGVHAQGSLAPRDIVARAIDLALKQSGEAHVLLDLAPIPRSTFERRFPGIFAECTRRGFNVPDEPLPVVPAAHYACGGVRTDADGRTTIAGLFAAGETACTGVHGANRLASNSLLEAVVYSHRAAAALPAELARAAAQPVRCAFADPPDAGMARGGDRAAVDTAALRDGLRRVMWEDAGIVRSTARLEAAIDAVAGIAQRLAAAGTGSDEPAAIEVRNLADTAALILSCAVQRRESRGLHHNTDHPYRDNERWLRDTVLAGDR